jgi:phage terminase small subunit
MAKQSKQDLFVEEYLIDLNATQAAIRAGYSVKTANEQGARLLANVSVQTKIAKAMAERSKRTGVNQDRVVLELAKMAFVNPSELIDTNTGKVLPGASPDDLACIQSVKVKKTTKGKNVIEEREVRVHDKIKALEKLGQHLGMWNDKIDVNVAVPVVICGEDDLED